MRADSLAHGCDLLFHGIDYLLIGFVSLHELVDVALGGFADVASRLIR